MVWFVNSTLGRIGRLDPATGDIKQWDSPSGPTSHPYALAVIDDKIWYAGELGGARGFAQGIT